ncbi:MAG: adenylate/guanylate cyclase domain-containing protein [Arenicellales bacterium]|nr:adenylate/guanylate cyclase domain-containing protein [Arenicellales bacterium]
MAENRRSGKLAVILHADVAGSTGLVQQDEQLAHDRIQDTFHRFGDTITQHHGYVRELRGDALLAEFARASDAVTAALVFQIDQSSYLAQLNDNILPTVRVGIAMGEVIIADDTITGAGVVLAQRLEQLAQPGSVVIQGAAYETIPGRFPFEYENRGEHEVKGFDQPVKLYTVRLKTGATLPDSTEVPKKKPTPVARWVAVVIVAVLIGGGGLLAWYQPWAPDFEPASVEKMSFPLPDKPSVAVLPFQNMSGDAEQSYFADGMAEDIITDLSKLDSLFVIARNSSFRYRGGAVDMKKVGRELGVKYLLEGSVRRVGNQLRINAQLIDTQSGGHLWAERYDGTMDDVFALQDQLTGQIVNALSVKLGANESIRLTGRGTSNVEAHDAFLKGREFYRRQTPQDLAEAIKMYKRALELDPKYAEAAAAIAMAMFRVNSSNWGSLFGLPSWFESFDESARYADIALEIDPQSALAHTVKGLTVYFRERHKFDESVVWARKGIELAPNDADAHLGLAMILVRGGEPAKSIEHLKTSRRLDPENEIEIELWLAYAYFGMEQYADAAKHAEQARNAAPENTEIWMVLSAIFGQQGEKAKATSAIETLNALRKANYQREFDEYLFELEMTFKYYKNEEDEDRLRQGLLNAGILK